MAAIKDGIPKVRLGSYITTTEGPTTAAIKLTKVARSIFREVDCLFREGVSQQRTVIILKKKAEKRTNKCNQYFLKIMKLN